MAVQHQLVDETPVAIAGAHSGSRRFESLFTLGADPSSKQNIGITRAVSNQLNGYI
jgi:hypothetical protein